MGPQQKSKKDILYNHGKTLSGPIMYHPSLSNTTRIPDYTPYTISSLTNQENQEYIISLQSNKYISIRNTTTGILLPFVFGINNNQTYSFSCLYVLKESIYAYECIDHVLYEW